MGRLIQDNGGQRTFSIFFKKEQFFDFIIINFVKASSQICCAKG